MTNLGIELLENPHPYKAMLCICSDLDETESADVYFNTSRFLNSKDQTEFGRGVGLEVGNSMYFYMPEGEISYWSLSERERGKIREMMRAGLIDCIHSFGDLASDRSQAAETLEHLDAEGCRLSVWIDHATAPSNFGSDIMRGFGDVPGHDVYHSDITLEYGVRFLSMGRVTSMQGQDAPVSLRGILDRRCLGASSMSVAKEATKVVFGLSGNRKYRMHGTNRLLSKVMLRDGRSAMEFLRSNPNPGGVSVGDTATGIASALNPAFLHRIVRRKGRSVIYTHLGKEIDRKTGFGEDAREALEHLAGMDEAGEVLVTTTSRLLEYVQMHRSIEWETISHKDYVEIAVSSSEASLSFTGLSFMVPSKARYQVTINAVPAEFAVVSTEDEYKSVLTVPWQRLN